jgi:NADP-reducing hydrogenase subunit HndB
MELRGGPREKQVVVHMGTCGIAAGARDVLMELIAELERKAVTDVTVRQSGCIGLCDQEPMLTLTDRDGRSFLYVNLTKGKVREIVSGHLVAGTPVTPYINKDMRPEPEAVRPERREEMRPERREEMHPERREDTRPERREDTRQERRGGRS